MDDYIYIYIYITHTQIIAYKQAYKYTYIGMYILVCIYLDVWYLCAYIHTYIYIHKHTYTQINTHANVCMLVGWLGFMAYQPLYVIWRQIHFVANSQFYFKQLSLAWIHSLIVKNISISSSLVYSNSSNLWGAYDKFPDFFRMGTFIDSTHMKF